MTDTPTPVVLDDDQGSSPAAIPTEGVTASGDERASPALAAQSDEDRFYAIKGLIERAMLDERDGKPCGCIIAAGCEARGYHDPEYAANGFIWQAAEAVARAVENSPSPALGGDEAKRSEHKDHPTPVGGLEPLLEKLRAVVTCGCDDDNAGRVGREAADRIEALQAQVAELQGLLATYDLCADVMQKKASKSDDDMLLNISDPVGEGVREKVARLVEKAWRDGFDTGPEGTGDIDEAWEDWKRQNPDFFNILALLSPGDAG